ncbi:AIM24 family protein [Streptomyces sp. DSM 44917]|uniref:AIM24 family protein n=1 Tax=Streptomyces boetiae TaxID=3075541 RepID=A0ABU2L4C2_9ACTN|nr:AIM24 family protein [Streptomyces sp. DSM 44917]MDT0306266.1 AIM24 family protein [Streptomyces sp. DSM 44917]
MDQRMIAGYAPGAPAARMENHGPTMARISLTAGQDVLARTGSMVAYEGFIQYESNPAALKQMFAGRITGESVPLMKCHGDGQLYLADYGADVVCLPLQGDNLSVNASNVLAFDAHLEWGVQRVKGIAKFAGQGFFNLGITGTGWVAVTSRGTPVVVDCGQAGETYVDPDALVAWSTGLRMTPKRSFKASSLIGRGSGEAFQLAFSGQGFVIVQPSEDSTDRLQQQQ